ncbi:T-cell surface antigen CD2-like [Astyanax mexicanus]|uniref:T-cell surface antigen CD2-like n=1 Tax=Astyanax mexicanus TaxID=7994 RepID=A0A8T2KYQ0_ASTMX|nr:T-cell surface antigen CD2-like [Astyanax mexicanus]
MKSRSSASLFLLCALIINNYTDSSACDFTVAVGSPVTINLGLDQTDELVWKHNSQRVFKGNVSTLPTKLNTAKVTSGSLEINSVKMKDNGAHEFEVFLSDGKSKAKKTITLCVHEKPPKPTVNVTCIDGTPYITCEVKGKSGLTFSWYKNGKQIDGNTASLKNIETNQDYECAVEKPIPSEKSSNKVRPAKCTSSENREDDDMLWGFERWIMITILAGGGSLVLVLMIVLVICACQSCKRREKHLQDEEEFKLHHFHTSPHSGQQRSKNTARGQPAPPVPQEDPEVSNYEVDEPPPKTQPRSKKSPRPPPPPVDDDEQPPPLPQPRKNGPHGKKNQGPLYMQQ